VNAYLTLLAAEQTVQVAEADVDRRQVFARSVNVLVENQLRAGAEASRANAELARAKANLARAQQQQEISRAVLADILGIADTRVEIREGPLVGPPPDGVPAASISDHPLAKTQRLRVDEFLSRAKVFDRTYYPKFDFESALYGRGTGANTDGSFPGGASGLDLQRSNWALGLTVTFSALDIFSIRAKKNIELADERAEAARYDRTIQDLTGQLRKAQASLEGARRVAEATPVELKAARDTETQERARYQAGLATIVEVSEAQSLLVQAEIDDVLARLAVWQNLAGVAASEGDLDPFIQLVVQKTQGGP
jgi:outer membrane protein TolC